MPERPTRSALPRLAPFLFCVCVAVLASRTRSQTPQGMDPSGRIPKVKLPDGLQNPERWRYIPEGRLMDGNIFERFLVSSFFTPILFREQDVGTGGGVAITDIDFRNQRRREFANVILAFTTEGQQTYRIIWRRWTNHFDLPGGGVIQDERSFLRAHAGYNKSLTTRYYGRGPNRPETAESSYTRERSQLEFRYQFTEPNPTDDLILDVGFGLEHNKLASGQVRDALNTRTAHPLDFAAGNDQDMLWVYLRARYDTRDSLHNPYSGWYVGASSSTALVQTGADVGSVFRVDGSKVFTVPPLFHDGGDDKEENPPTDTLAFGAFTTATAGTLPFYSLPSLGGSTALRGYINNRWTDRTSWHAAAEYRFWFQPRGFAITDQVRVERVGAALFYEVGSVAPNWTDLFDDKPKYSYGAGLRIGLERTATFRFDLGISDEDTNFSIAFGLTF